MAAKRLRLLPANDDDDVQEGMYGAGVGNEYKELKDFMEQYGNFRQNRLYYSPSGRRLYLRIDCYGQQLTWKFFYDNLLALYYTDPRISHVTIQLAFIIFNLQTLQARFWYPSNNSSIIANNETIHINKNNLESSFSKIKRQLQFAEENDFLNRFTLAYSETSLSSVAIPFYVLYSGYISMN